VVALTNQSLFVGTQEDDVVSGTSGGDYLYGSTGNDTFRGLAGFDILRGSDGNDTVFGGTGSDGLDGNAGNDTLFGEDGVDNLRGDEGVDQLNGGDGNDILSGGGGADTLLGGAGADIFVYHDARESRGSGTDHIADFEAQDRIDLSSLEPGAAEFAFIGSAAFTAVGQIRAETIGTVTHVEANTGGDRSPEFTIDLDNAAVFTADNLILTGNPNHDSGGDSVIVGDGGDLLAPIPTADVLSGGAGNDYLYGGQLDDIVSGGPDNDIVRGSEGNDTLHGDQGHDVLDGSIGNDLMFGDDGNDILRGQNGADQLDGGPGDDQLDGGAGNDRLFDPSGANDLHGGAGSDSVVSQAVEWSTASGDDANDYVSVASGVAFGGGANDHVEGITVGGSTAVAEGDAGIDTFRAQVFNDGVHGVVAFADFKSGTDKMLVFGDHSAADNWATLDVNHDNVLNAADGHYVDANGMSLHVGDDDIWVAGVNQINASDWVMGGV
jgi:Ca2+-binding RTX toxin-like protein